MRVGEYVNMLRNADIHVTENTVRKGIIDLLSIMKDYDLLLLLHRLDEVEDLWLIRQIDAILARRLAKRVEQ